MADEVVTVKCEPDWQLEEESDEDEGGGGEGEETGGEEDEEYGVAPKEDCSAVKPAWVKTETDSPDELSSEGMDTESSFSAPITLSLCSKKFQGQNDEEILANSTFEDNQPPKKEAMRAKRRKGRKITYCSVCGKMFTRQSNLNQHMLVHTGERPWPCTVCAKTFTNKSNLKQHMLMHSGVKSYICPECNKAFTIHSHLVRHKKVHTGEKPFTCPECRRCFTQKSNLTQHLLVHAGVKPHSCTQCGKSFSSRSTLKQHLLLHAGIRPWSCPNCEKTFAQKSNLTQHMFVHHNKPIKGPLEVTPSIIEGSDNIELKEEPLGDDEPSGTDNSVDYVASMAEDSVGNVDKMSYG